MHTRLTNPAARSFSRRDIFRAIGASAAFTTFPALQAAPTTPVADSLAMQFYKSLTEEQHAKIVLPSDHAKRGYVSNWWYICPEQRLHTFYTREQQDLVRQIFESLHHPDYREKMNWQVQKDLMGQIKNTPSVAFFGKPQDDDFEFIYTGHHVTRRTFVHPTHAAGFGGRPIFYGNFAKAFREEQDHAGNPFWYQGLLFNDFVRVLDGKQREKMLVAQQPRPEKPAEVIARRANDLPGLAAVELTLDQQSKLLETLRRMLACFRPADVETTMHTLESQNLISQFFISCYGGEFDIGGDKVWDTWQIEGPDMVWYFRGYPHIHGYFHLAAG
ncbi:MAG: DUF3500 domain-containing protein [Prosthecobacter sp.]